MPYCFRSFLGRKIFNAVRSAMSAAAVLLVLPPWFALWLMFRSLQLNAVMLVLGLGLGP